MPTSLVDSVVFRDIFGTEPMRRVWSDGNRTQALSNTSHKIPFEITKIPCIFPDDHRLEAYL